MNGGARFAGVLLAASWLMAVLPAWGQSPASMAKQAPAWQPPQPQQIKAEAFAWLDTTKADASARAKAEALWSGMSAGASEGDLLLRLARTFALVDANAARLLTLCGQPRNQLAAPRQPWLRDPKLAPLEANNLRLLYGRWLVEASLYDEALEQLSDLGPADVVAPASLLFYQAIVYHALLNKESGLNSIDVLLQGAEVSPHRYVALARMMQDDLNGLEEDSLDHIARRMGDIQRRLDLGRAGPKVRRAENGVIESLDKLIKKIEEQQQQSAGSGGGVQSRSPMQDSHIAGGKGPGNVERKNIGSESGWGDLPPKEREEAMQEVGRDFPAHYRDAIEQYFRRLAAEKNE